ncbi:MAG: hypothetical protein ACYDEQ_05055 [Desulfocucumaceae bacterium]
MEWALSVCNRKNLQLINRPWGEEMPGRYASLFGETLFSRLYFGQEFCERLMPTAEDLAEAIYASREKKLAFTLVTPYVTEGGLEKAEILLSKLVELQPRCEVVANDWGLLYLLRRKYPTLEPVMGRLINKACRDPRIASHIKESPSDTLKMYSRCSASNPYMKSLLNILKVKRIEIDNLPQGLDDSLPGRGYLLSLYVPYGFISTGSICLTGSWGQKRDKKFRTSEKSCSRLCRYYSLEMRDLRGQVDNKNNSWRVFQKGNTVFYQQLEGFLDKGLTWARDNGADRVVYQPEPM